jgi:hypothetical protein
VQQGGKDVVELGGFDVLAVLGSFGVVKDDQAEGSVVGVVGAGVIFDGVEVLMPTLPTDRQAKSSK